MDRTCLFLLNMSYRHREAINFIPQDQIWKYVGRYTDPITKLKNIKYFVIGTLFENVIHLLVVSFEDVTKFDEKDEK